MVSVSKQLDGENSRVEQKRIILSL